MCPGVHYSLMLIRKTGAEGTRPAKFSKSRICQKAICALDGYELLFDAPTFHEFAVKTPLAVDVIASKLLEHKVIGGVNLQPLYPEFGEAMLFCVTEQHTKTDIDMLVNLLHTIERESEVL